MQGAHNVLTALLDYSVSSHHAFRLFQAAQSLQSLNTRFLCNVDAKVKRRSEQTLSRRCVQSARNMLTVLLGCAFRLLSLRERFVHSARNVATLLDGRWFASSCPKGVLVTHSQHQQELSKCADGS